VEKACVDHARRVPHRNMKNGFSRARKSHGASSAGDFRKDGVNLPGYDLVDGREPDSILVAKGKITQ